MNRLQQLSSFVAVVDAGSFVGAATATGLSKAALSRHVAELEQRLGVRLIHRTTRRLALSDDGVRLLHRARDLLAGLEDLESELSAAHSEATGVLRINAPLSFGVRVLSSLWGAFLARHPRLKLEVMLEDRVIDLVDEGCDAAIRIGRLPDSQLVARPLARTRIVLCATAAYLARHGTPVHPAELAGHRTLGYSYWSLGDVWRFTAVADGTVTEVRTRPLLVSNNGDTCLAAALDHQGIALQPDFIVGADLARGALVEVLPQWRGFELPIHLVHPSRRHVPARTRLLVDYLQSVFAGVPPWLRDANAGSGALEEFPP